MPPCLVVFTDFSPAAARARAYAAALAAPLNAELHLVHIYLPPTTPAPIAAVLRATNDRYVRETRQALDELAADLPVPATAELIGTDWDEAVQQVLRTYRPLLVQRPRSFCHCQEALRQSNPAQAHRLHSPVRFAALARTTPF
ncbi:MAG: universal stress protein [Hymenobacteraceae bacterium]|nr:universal stress protein [Hymenobacteraceae bacterium]